MDDRSDSEFSEWTHLSEPSNCQSSILTSMKELLVGKVFVGEYVERHYVDFLSTYRDLVVVNSDELEFAKSVTEVTKIVRQTYGQTRWFGVTDNEHDGTPKGFCLWVNFYQIPLGKHWFQIESIDLSEKEITLRLKHLRLLDSSKAQNFAKEEAPAELLENFDVQKFVQELKWSEVRDLGLKGLIDASTWCAVNFTNIMTIENIRETMRFSSVLIIVVVTFLVEAAKFLCNYSIKLMHELSNVIRSSTPIILGVVDFFAKCVGGFYLLIVMLWRGSSGPPIPANALSAAFNRDNGRSGRKAIGYGPPGQRRFPYAQRVPQPRGRFSEY